VIPAALVGLPIKLRILKKMTQTRQEDANAEE